MPHSNRPLTSREFKIILDRNRFMDKKKGIQELSAIIKGLIEKQNGRFMDDIKEKERTTWYLDTNAYELYCNNNFLLRIRKEKNSEEYDVTLKCRHSDRYVSASYDLASSIEGIDIKFEEDIVIPFISKFSLSASLKGKQIPRFNTMQDVVSVFPGLDLGIETGKMLSKVNNFEVVEISSKIGKIAFSDDATEIEPELNLWYSSIKEDRPLIVEFTFKCKAAKQDKAEKMLLEEYPHSLVLEADSFYHSLQKDKIVDKQATKTKTDLVYSNCFKP